MTRLVTVDFEGGSASPFTATGGAGTIGATGALDGTQGWRSGQNAASLLSLAAINWSYPAVGQWIYFRARVRISGAPTSAATILHLRVGGTQIGAIRLNTTRTLNLLASTGTVIGSASSALTAAQAYTVELGVRVNGSSATDNFEARLDGVSFASGNSSVTDSQIDNPRAGWVTSPGASSNVTIDLDSIAINDDTGASDNTWPGVPGAGGLPVALDGTTTGSSTDTGELTVDRPLTGTSSGTSTDSGEVTVARPVTGTSSGSSSDTAALTAEKALTGSTTGSSSDAADVTVARPLTGSSAGGSSDAADLTIARPLDGSSTGGSSDTGDVTVGGGLTGSSTGGSTDTGNLTVGAALTGMSIGTSTDAGQLTVGSPSTHPAHITARAGQTHITTRAPRTRATARATTKRITTR